MTTLAFDASLTRSVHLVFGGVVAPPPPALPADEVSGECFSRWDAGEDATGALFVAFEPAEVACGMAVEKWGQADTVGNDTGEAYQPTAPAGMGFSDLCTDVAPVGFDGLDRWQDCSPVGSDGREYWHDCMPAGIYQGEAVQMALAMRADHWSVSRSAFPAGIVARHVAQACQPLHVLSGERWQADMPPPPGYWFRPEVVPPEIGEHLTHLRFRAAVSHSRHLVFGRIDPAPGTVLIPVRSVYIVINSASVRRVSNNLALPVTGLQVQIDASGPKWSWSASMPVSALGDLERDAPGVPVELEAVVNGFVIRLLVDRVARRESFGSRSLAVSGGGVEMEISAPAFPVVSHHNAGGSATAQQLGEAALSVNGVGLGWDLDWQCADWLVPAGAWVHQGSAIDAVRRIAEACGAYVQPAPASRVLRVLPRYPIAPWGWSTAEPSVVIPADVAQSLSVDYIAQPDYDVVYVSGQAGGINARVKRGGSAGAQPAQMIVDQLVTHADAARGRGLEILGNTGVQQLISLEMPILEEVGAVPVGTLMDWVEGGISRRGLTRGMSISVTVPQGTSGDPLRVRQTIEVETHG